MGRGGEAFRGQTDSDHRDRLVRLDAALQAPVARPRCRRPRRGSCAPSRCAGVRPLQTVLPHPRQEVSNHAVQGPDGDEPLQQSRAGFLTLSRHRVLRQGDSGVRQDGSGEQTGGDRARALPASMGSCRERAQTTATEPARRLRALASTVHCGASLRSSAEEGGRGLRRPRCRPREGFARYRPRPGPPPAGVRPCGPPDDQVAPRRGSRTGRKTTSVDTTLSSVDRIPTPKACLRVYSRLLRESVI